MDATRGVDVGGHGPHLGNEAQSELHTDFKFRLGVEQKEANHDQGIDGSESWLPRFELPERFSQPMMVQFQACLWKQNLTYWRSPYYNALRFFFTVIVAILVWIHFLEH